MVSSTLEGRTEVTIRTSSRSPNPGWWAFSTTFRSIGEPGSDGTSRASTSPLPASRNPPAGRRCSRPDHPSRRETARPHCQDGVVALFDEYLNMLRGGRRGWEAWANNSSMPPANVTDVYRTGEPREFQRPPTMAAPVGSSGWGRRLRNRQTLKRVPHGRCEPTSRTLGGPPTVLSAARSRGAPPRVPRLPNRNSWGLFGVSPHPFGVGVESGNPFGPVRHDSRHSRPWVLASVRCQVARDTIRCATAILLGAGRFPPASRPGG